MSGKDASQADWAQKRLVRAEGYVGWDRGWLEMEALDTANRVDGHSIPQNVWAFENVPDTYTHVMFRGAKDPGAGNGAGGNFWFSPPLEISKAYSYPCFAIWTALPLAAHGMRSPWNRKTTASSTAAGGP